MVLARARPCGPIANAYLVLNLFLAGDRMVNAQSYLSKHKSYEKSSTHIFIEKTKPGILRPQPVAGVPVRSLRRSGDKTRKFWPKSAPDRRLFDRPSYFQFV